MADWIDGAGKRHRENFGPSKQDAERRLTKAVRDRDLELAGMKIEQGLDVAFVELVAEYLLDVELRATKASHRTRKESLALFVKTMAVRLTRDVTPAVVQLFMRRRIEQKRAPRTINNDVLAIQACLNFAVRQGRIALNPIARLRRLPVNGTGKQLPRALSEEECLRLLHVAEDVSGGASKPRPLLLRALLETGARWSELTAVTWADVLWLQKSIRLRSATTKNRTERVIPIGPELEELLRGIAPHSGEGPVRSSALVFQSPWGHPWGQSHNFRDWLDEMLVLASIPRKDGDGHVVNVHALRHTFATRLARAGVPLQQAAYLTGHKTLSVLMQIYTHLQADDVRNAVSRLSLGPAKVGNNLAMRRKRAKSPSAPDDTSPGEHEGSVGGPHWTRTSNLHAVNMALCQLS